MRDSFSNDKVTLRPVAEQDRDDIFGYINAPELRGLRQLENDPLAPLSEKAIDGAIESLSDTDKKLGLVVAPTGQDVVVGHVVSDWRWDAGSPFVGVAIAPRHRRQGYGSAALDVILGLLFRQTVAFTVQAWTPSWNEGGIAFVEAMGFSPAGAIRRAGRRHDDWYEDLAFDLLKREWQEHR